MTDKEYYTKRIYKKDGEMKVSHKYIYRVLKEDARRFKTEKYYLKYWCKSQGHYKIIDSDYYRMMDFILLYGIPYIKGNDGKRGGLEKDYIIVKYDRRNKFIKSLLAE